MKTICVYCGSRLGHLAEYVDAAWAVGEEIARRKMTLVYGGARIGLMGAVANAAIAGGAEVIGIIPKKLENCEVAHSGLSRLIITQTMHERKMKMVELSDGFIALPGGIGTMDELFEVFTWLQLGFVKKPVAMLNTAGFYDKLISFLETMQAEQFLHQEHRDLLLVDTDISALIEQMKGFKPSLRSKLDGVDMSFIRQPATI